MAAPKEIAELVNRFRLHRAAYQSAAYNETQVRREFVDPFFEALGWDVNNRQGYSESYKDVVHEDSVSVQGRPRSPDYSFRIGGVRKFFVETKKPSVNLKSDPAPAFQLRRYAWSAKLGLSILTDFEEFAIYESRSKPHPNDRSSVGRVLYFTFEDYEDRWDFLYGLLSPESIRKGAFDRYLSETVTKRGAEQVDDAFLSSIENWRELLARNIALRNELSADALNYSVQMTLDRIVFLRMAEDRGLEDYGQLLKASSTTGAYKELQRLYQNADRRYNSGLFHFGGGSSSNSDADSITPSLAIDDKVLKEIATSLYYPNSPYEFSVLSADILGQVYERFLGKVIRLTAGGRRITIEEKPEVRKAGGVFYTPTFVVSDIVSQVLNPLLESYKPPFGKETKGARLRVLDPACGSGSFLLGAYQHLLDWHRRWYEVDDANRWQARGRLQKMNQQEYRLTIEERKRILVDCIYGVDIDAQAVEVTKLSLLLKVLEGETQQNIQRSLDVFNDRALPDLDRNIRRGNSLVESDFLLDQNLNFLAGAPSDIRCFDWTAEFPEIFQKSGGFDAVVGNPPYVLMQSLDAPDVSRYFGAHFVAAKYKIDTYHLFIERGLRLLRNGGLLGYIVPSSYLRNKHARALRELLLTKSEIARIRTFYFPVFREASVDCSEIICKRVDAVAVDHEVEIIRSNSPDANSVSARVPQSTWLAHPERQFGLSQGGDGASIQAKIEAKSVVLGSFAKAYFGVQTFDRSKYVASASKGAAYRPIVDGSNIDRYFLLPSTEYLDFRDAAIKSGGNKEVYARPRIVVRQIGEVPTAALAPSGLVTLNTIYNIYIAKEIGYDLRFVLAVINSSVVGWYWRRANSDEKRVFPKVKKDALLSIPIPKLDFSIPSERAKHDAVVSLVDVMMQVKSDLQKAGTPSSRDALVTKARVLDKRIETEIASMFLLDESDISKMAGGSDSAAS